MRAFTIHFALDFDAFWLFMMRFFRGSLGEMKRLLSFGGCLPEHCKKG
ncbi:conserved hypothetical protein [delta proteobacterium NaphS2]|nr:conserved hypothetical protein [delta proteobacterium NaphS2]